MVKRVEDLRKLGARAAKSLPLDLIHEADDGPEVVLDSTEPPAPLPPQEPANESALVEPQKDL